MLHSLGGGSIFMLENISLQNLYGKDSNNSLLKKSSSLTQISVSVLSIIYCGLLCWGGVGELY